MLSLLAGMCGETIYFGDVFEDVAVDTPLYVYERCVDGHRSVHLTRDAAGDVVHAEAAEHTDDYTVVRAALLRDQLSTEATLTVADGRWTFETTSPDRSRVRTERARGPLVVGPTLIGWVLEHPVTVGERVPVRFAALDRGRTFAFVLARADAHTVRMSARSPWVGIVVRPVTLTFDDAGRIVSLDGRVPPRIQERGRWRPLEAHVRYRPIAAAYR